VNSFEFARSQIVFVKMQWYRWAKIFCNICWNIYLPVTNKHPS